MAAIDNLLRDTATLARQRDTAIAARLAPLPGSAQSMLMALPIGTRVVDLVTGEEGVIIDGHRENVVIPLASEPGR